MWFNVNTNVNFISGNFSIELIELTRNIIIPRRNSKILNDQLIIGWDYSEDLKASAFNIFIRKSLLISGILLEQPEQLGGPWPDQTMLRPFSHTFAHRE